jgi:hypothetical protein
MWRTIFRQSNAICSLWDVYPCGKIEIWVLQRTHVSEEVHVWVVYFVFQKSTIFKVWNWEASIQLNLNSFHFPWSNSHFNDFLCVTFLHHRTCCNERVNVKHHIYHPVKYQLEFRCVSENACTSSSGSQDIRNKIYKDSFLLISILFPCIIYIFNNFPKL